MKLISGVLYHDSIAVPGTNVVKYSPGWTGAGETRHPIWIPDVVYEYFEMEEHEEYDLMVLFTKETWHGRMRACRGVGASLEADELAKWDKEHRRLLETNAPDFIQAFLYERDEAGKYREEKISCKFAGQ